MAEKTSPLISVITVCYNSAEYIRYCIESVLNQECNDFEYVMIDGGSTDGTAEIIRSYQDRLAYWHSKKDKGLADAFNQGVQHSQGEWLYFLNSDDYLINPHSLSKLAQAAREHPDCDVVFGQTMVVNREPEPKPSKYIYGQPFRWWRFLLRDTIPHPAALTSRVYFAKVGNFSEDFRIAMDYEHYLRAGSQLRTYFFPEVISCMRVGGLSSNVLASLRECRRAHLANEVLPTRMISLLHYFLVLKSFVGRIIRAIRKRFSSNLFLLKNF